MIDVATMRAAGFTDEQIIRMIEAEQKERAAKIKDQNRIRQQNQRSRNAIERDRHDVTRDMRDTVNALSLVSKKEDLKTKKERGGFVCPSDFKPDERDYKLGSDWGLSRQQVDSQSTSMIEWSQANRNRAVARKSDWHLTLHGFLRRVGTAPAPAPMSAEEYHRKYTQGNSNGQATKTATSDGDGIARTDNEQELFPPWGTLHPDRTSKR